MDETVNALIALSDPASTMTLQAACSEHRRLSDDLLRNIHFKYERVIPDSRMKVLFDAVDQSASFRIVNGSLLAIFVKHEDWSGAAGMTASDDWDTAVYYYRKMGRRGRLLLVRASIFRRFTRRMIDASLQELPGFVRVG
ncbi:MAG TPA: hypothetical protein VM492_11215 [Sumerlaeia bacterium]|nr:hypothetical protein [Sumerlaeia bacterium]